MLQVSSPSGSQAVDQGEDPPRASVVGAQATDRGMHQLGALAVCAWAAGLLIRVCTVASLLSDNSVFRLTSFSLTPKNTQLPSCCLMDKKRIEC